MGTSTNRKPLTWGLSHPSSNDKKDDSPNQIQAKVTAWIAEHKTDFVAHAIWEDNVKLTLDCGKVRPVECRLRQDLKVSYEKGAGYGERGISDITRVVNALRQDSTEIPPSCLRLHDRIPVTEAEALGIISDEQFMKIWDMNKSQKESKVNQLGSLEITYKDNTKQKHVVCIDLEAKITKNLANVYIEGIPSIEKLALLPYREKIAALQKKYGCGDNLVEIAVDREHKDDAVDKQLATVLQKWTEIVPDSAQVHAHIRDLRNYKIPASKIDLEVRTFYGCIGWKYGSVVILRGNTNKILGNLNSKLVKGSEAKLLRPYENGGEFFTLDLADKDTLVIGPQKILSGYQEKAKQKGFQLCYLEEMTQDQLDFFEVPVELRNLTNNNSETTSNKM